MLSNQFQRKIYDEGSDNNSDDNGNYYDLLRAIIILYLRFRKSNIDVGAAREADKVEQRLSVESAASHAVEAVGEARAVAQAARLALGLRAEPQFRAAREGQYLKRQESVAAAVSVAIQREPPLAPVAPVPPRVEPLRTATNWRTTCVAHSELPASDHSYS